MLNIPSICSKPCHLTSTSFHFRCRVWLVYEIIRARTRLSEESRFKWFMRSQWTPLVYSLSDNCDYALRSFTFSLRVGFAQSNFHQVESNFAGNRSLTLSIQIASIPEKSDKTKGFFTGQVFIVDINHSRARAWTNFIPKLAVLYRLNKFSQLPCFTKTSFPASGFVFNLYRHQEETSSIWHKEQ